MKYFIKFFVKVYLIQGLVKIFLFLNKNSKQKECSNRVLIIDTQAIGDLVVATGTLKHYRHAFPDKKIDFIIKKGTGMEKFLSAYCDQVIVIDYDKYKKNPIYAYRFIKERRRVRYDVAIVHDHAIAEIEAKEIAMLLEARKTLMYEGFLLQQTKPINKYMELNCRYVKKTIFPNCTKVIDSFDRVSKKEIASVLEHYQYFYEQITDRKEVEYESILKIFEDDKEWRDAELKKRGIEKKKYAVFTIGSSSKWKNWPVERFGFIAKELLKKEISVVITGSVGDYELGKKLAKLSSNIIWNATGETSIAQSAAIIETALLVVSNDTSSVHIAIALKTPCICIIGTGQLGSISLYGYPDIHHWVYKKGWCYLDNWRCVNDLSDEGVSPCIMDVSTEMVIDRLEKLLQYLKTQSHIPNTHFHASYTQ